MWKLCAENAKGYESESSNRQSRASNISVLTLQENTAQIVSQPPTNATLQAQSLVRCPAWDQATVMACWAQLSPVHVLPRCEQESSLQLVAVAQRAHLPPPRNGEELLKTIYALPLTNEEDGCIFGILSGVTNEAMAELVFWAITNFHYAWLSVSEADPVLRHWLHSKVTTSITALRNIGTPTVMDRLNKLLRQLLNEGHEIHEPGECIDPDRYPAEAHMWLLDYPEPLVRYRMLGEWLHSSRPETPELVDAWCRRLHKMPDDFYLWKDDPDIAASKRRIALSAVRLRHEYVRRYKRWIDDGQRMPLHYGCYEDDRWDKYRKLSEEERRGRYGAQYGSSQPLGRSR
jgi:hypothetical protein